jgi:hypothetical protein
VAGVHALVGLVVEVERFSGNLGELVQKLQAEVIGEEGMGRGGGGWRREMENRCNEGGHGRRHIMQVIGIFIIEIRVSVG